MSISHERIKEIAHRKAWRYKHSTDPHHSDTYTFNDMCLIDLCRAIEAECQKAEPVAQEPFGIWHQGDTEEESDFFLYKDSGDVSCPRCIKLYTAPPDLAAEVERLRKQCAAYKLLTGAQEERLSDHAKMVESRKEAIATLDSERAANALMTQRIAELEAALREAKNALRSVSRGVTPELRAALATIDKALGDNAVGKARPAASRRRP